jgi:hypothetical protein
VNENMLAELSKFLAAWIERLAAEGYTVRQDPGDGARNPPTVRQTTGKGGRS